MGSNPLAADLLNLLLQIDPDRRPSAEEALAHPYLASYADPDDEVNTVLDCTVSTPSLMDALVPGALSFTERVYCCIY